MSEDRPQDPTSPWSTPAVPSGPTPPDAPLPYGQGSSPPPPGYGQQPQPYAQQYGSVGPGQGYARDPQAAKVRSSATLWLILNIVSVLLCSNLPGIAGAIYAGLALGRADVDPADAQRKVRLSKIWFFAGLVLVLLVAVVGAIALVVFSSQSGNTFPSST